MARLDSDRWQASEGLLILQHENGTAKKQSCLEEVDGEKKRVSLDKANTAAQHPAHRAAARTSRTFRNGY
jgi:hypothetical protein